jgi:hypothetical protein
MLVLLILVNQLAVYDGIVPGRTVHVVYTRRPQEMFLPSDDFEDRNISTWHTLKNLLY